MSRSADDYWLKELDLAALNAQHPWLRAEEVVMRFPVHAHASDLDETAWVVRCRGGNFELIITEGEEPMVGTPAWVEEQIEELGWMQGQLRRALALLADSEAPVE